MFTWVNNLCVRSNSGFEVQFTGRFSAEYREGGKVVMLNVESGLDGSMPCIILNPLESFTHWNDGTVIPKEKRAQMFQNFKEAMKFQGLKMVVESPMSWDEIMNHKGGWVET